MNGLKFRPDQEQLRRGLDDVGEGQHTQLDELAVRPSAPACDVLICNLDGAKRHVQADRGRLLQDGAE